MPDSNFGRSSKSQSSGIGDQELSRLAEAFSQMPKRRMVSGRRSQEVGELLTALGRYNIQPNLKGKLNPIDQLMTDIMRQVQPKLFVSDANTFVERFSYKLQEKMPQIKYFKRTSGDIGVLREELGIVFVGLDSLVDTVVDHSQIVEGKVVCSLHIDKIAFVIDHMPERSKEAVIRSIREYVVKRICGTKDPYVAGYINYGERKISPTQELHIRFCLSYVLTLFKCGSLIFPNFCSTTEIPAQFDRVNGSRIFASEVPAEAIVDHFNGVTDLAVAETYQLHTEVFADHRPAAARLDLGLDVHLAAHADDLDLEVLMDTDDDTPLTPTPATPTPAKPMSSDEARQIADEILISFDLES